MIGKLFAKFPATAKIAAAVMAASVPVIGWAQTTFHWVAGQTVAVSATTGATVALLGFVVEHLRKETPERPVGIFGLLLAEVPTVGALGVAFSWWSVEVSDRWTGAIVSAVAVVAALVGVTITQRQVTSKRTRDEELASTAAIAQASARRGGDGTGIPPA